MTQTTAAHLSVAEVAERLELHEATVYRLIESGELPAQKLPVGFTRSRALRVSSEDLAEFIRQRTEGDVA